MRAITWISVLATVLFAPFSSLAQQQCPLGASPMFALDPNPSEITALNADFARQSKAYATQEKITLTELANKHLALAWTKYHRDKDAYQAMFTFNQIWLYAPNNPGSYHGMAYMSLMLIDQNKYAGCGFTSKLIERLFLKALSYKNAAIMAKVHYARFLNFSDRYDDGIAILQSVYDQNPKVRSVYVDMVFAYKQTNQPEKACVWIRRGLKRGYFTNQDAAAECS